MSAYRARQTVVAFGLSAVGLVCAAWLLVNELQEIDAGLRLPRGAR